MVHLETVSDGCQQQNAKIVALLHDIIEDTSCTYEDLKDWGFSDTVIEAVKAITKVVSEDYQDYLNRVKNNIIAREVKISDLKHNMDLTRLREVTGEDRTRQEKYRKALEYLEND